jgi:two-component system, OmpR family, sensor kinase
MPLNLKGRVVLQHLVAVALVLGLAALGADWVFSRMVRGQFDQTLLDLADTEAAAALASPNGPIQVHEMPTGTAPPSFPRLDKFVQIVDLDGQVLASSVNLGTARLPTPSPLLTQLRAGRPVFETRPDFGDEPLRLVSVPIERGGVRYAIQVAGSLDDAHAAQRSARLLFLAMSTAILGAVALVGALLARAILMPIDRVVQRARLIEGARLDDRLPHPGGRDEIAHLVETLNEMLGRIAQGFDAQRRFTADAAHELRSPISRLRSELEVTLRRPRASGEYKAALQSCLEEVERLSQLTEQLLLLARLDAGEPRESAVQSVPLAPILKEAMTHLAPDALQRDVTLAVDAPAGVVVRADPAAASVVVANILRNAVKFSPPGGRVRVEVSTDAADAVVTVSDSGPGIPEAEIPRLFERFYRGSAARASDVPGVGLGLAICRVLVEGQGGSIAVSNSRGGGTTFHIRLPLAA